MKKLFFLIIILFPLIVFAQPQNGMQSIDFTLLDEKGDKISLSDYRGKLVLLDFWASWCGPCRKENPNVVEAYKKYRDKTFFNADGFVVLSVSLDRNEDAWLKAIKKDNLDWDSHVWDNEGKVTRKYGVQFIPYPFLINGKGEIIAQGEELRGMGLHIAIDKRVKE